MKEVINEVLDLKVPMLYYASVAEADQAAGRADAALDECNKNLAYRGAYAEARDLICDVAEELSGIPRKTKPSLDDKGQPRKNAAGEDLFVVDEKESIYVARVLAAGTITKEQLQDLVAKRARGYKTADGSDVGPIAVDITERVKAAPKPKKLPDTLKSAAKQLLGKHDDAKINKTLGKFLPAEKAVFVRTNDEAKDVETLGWLIREYQAAKLAAGEL